MSISSLISQRVLASVARGLGAQRFPGKDSLGWKRWFAEEKAEAESCLASCNCKLLISRVIDFSTQAADLPRACRELSASGPRTFSSVLLGEVVRGWRGSIACSCSACCGRTA